MRKKEIKKIPNKKYTYYTDYLNEDGKFIKKPNHSKNKSQSNIKNISNKKKDKKENNNNSQIEENNLNET